MMTIDDFEFIKSDDPKKPGLGLYIRGHWVFKYLFLAAWQQASVGWEKLNWNIEQPAKAICEVEFWLRHALRERRMMGRALKCFVDHDMLPLRLANPNKRKGKHTYILT